MEDRQNFWREPIIVDLGSSSIKAGISFGKEDIIEFTNCIGEPKYKKINRSYEKDLPDNREIYVGKDCDKLLGVLKLRYPLKNGVFTNEQDILTVFNHIYSKLEIKSEQIKERPIFITEPILNSFNHRKQIASILFDTLSVPALFFGSQPLLSLYSSGNQSGVILETGDGISQCCVVYEGFSIPHSEVRSDFGGRNVTEFLQTKLRKNGYNFSTTAEYEIVKKIKETMCLTSLNGCFDYGKLAELGANSYSLPDGNSVLVGKERMEAPEILFRPGEAGLEFMSLPEMIHTSLNKVEMEIRTTLYRNIHVSGGNSLLKGFPERITNEVKKLAPRHMKVMTHAPSNRKYNCWHGASLISGLSSFKGMWVKRNEYIEKGEKEIYIKTI